MTIHPTPQEKPTNREGQLSPRQRRLVQEERGWAYKLVLVLMILGIVYSSLGLWGALTAFSALTLYYYVDVIHGMRATLGRVEVKSIRGMLTRDKIEEEGATTRYMLRIAGREFSIPAAAYHSLTDEGVYAKVYFIQEHEYLFHEVLKQENVPAIFRA